MLSALLGNEPAASVSQQRLKVMSLTWVIFCIGAHGNGIFNLTFSWNFSI